jgi:hypothetical protein
MTSSGRFSTGRLAPTVAQAGNDPLYQTALCAGLHKQRQTMMQVSFPKRSSNKFAFGRMRAHHHCASLILRTV